MFVKKSFFVTSFENGLVHFPLKYNALIKIKRASGDISSIMSTSRFSVFLAHQAFIVAIADAELKSKLSTQALYFNLFISINVFFTTKP